MPSVSANLVSSADSSGIGRRNINRHPTQVQHSSLPKQEEAPSGELGSQRSTTYPRGIADHEIRGTGTQFEDRRLYPDRVGLTDNNTGNPGLHHHTKPLDIAWA